jgi:YD repeat-containing protein
VTGTSFGGVTAYASNLQYRAWGALKHLDYGNARALDLAYDERLRPVSYSVPGLISKTYEYDARGHLTGRVSRRWGQEVSFWPQSQPYVNDRNAAWAYDVDGNLVDSDDVQYTYDDAGRKVATDGYWRDVAQTFDGDGLAVKAVDVRTYHDEFGPQQPATTTTGVYELRSTALGGRLVTELNETGAKRRTLVYMGESVLAWQQGTGAGSGSVRWEHGDAGGASFRMSTQGGAGVPDMAAELDPLGTNAGLSAPQPPRPSQLQVKMMFQSLHPGFGDRSVAKISACQHIEGGAYTLARLIVAKIFFATPPG